MIIEIEKKYSFNEEDYKIITSKCKSEWKSEIKDFYLDLPDYRLFKKDYYLRMRNGLYELKISKFIKETWLVVSKEINEEEEIEKILKEKFNMSVDDTTWVLYVETNREKYTYEMDWETITVDIDFYQYGERYEIEVISESKTEEEVNQLIEKFREELWLQSNYDIDWGWKVFICSQHQNIEIFEIMNNK